MSPRSSKKSVLLHAAARVVAERGYAALTLDAVGSAAGISKGGVLYHFASKDLLVAALLEQLTASFDDDQRTAHAGADAGPGAWTRAYLTASTQPAADGEREAGVAVLAAAGHDPSLLQPLRAAYDGWIERIDSDGLPGVDAHVVRLAADGLWAADLFGLAPPSPELRERVLHRLRELAGASAAAAVQA